MTNRLEHDRAELVSLAWEQGHNIGRREQARVLARLAGRASRAAVQLLDKARGAHGGPLSFGTG